MKPTWAEVVDRDYEPWSRTPLRLDTATTSVDVAAEQVTSAMRAARRS